MYCFFNKHYLISAFLVLSVTQSYIKIFASQFSTQNESVNQWLAQEKAATQYCKTKRNAADGMSHYNPLTAPKFKYDVTLVGFANYADGIGKHPILFKNCLDKKININFLSTRNIPHDQEDAELGLPRLNIEKTTDIGSIAILTDIVADKALDIAKKMPNSFLKVAYTKFEATEIPQKWVDILNTKFDMAVVPDPFLVDIYKKSGVLIPLFVLPLPIQKEDFFKINFDDKKTRPFTFGFSGGFWARKNHIKVLQAFAAEFGNRKDVQLKLHGRFGEQEIIQTLTETIAQYKLENVELITKPLDHFEYFDFFKSLDCFVSLSMGEGFAATPREALAGAIPCILTDNTAQSTICSSGCILTVPSKIQVASLYDCHEGQDASSVKNLSSNRNFPSQLIKKIMHDSNRSTTTLGHIGYNFDCSLKDAQAAMREMYTNYSFYKKKAELGQVWVQRYLCENLRKKYQNLVKPSSIVFGEYNIIGEGFLMTNSSALYEKYQYLLGNP